MKKLKLYLTAVLIAGLITGCQEEDPVEKDLDKLSNLVEETEQDLEDDDLTQDWETLRSDYIDLKSNLADEKEKMSDKQHEEYQKTVDQWNQVAEQYYLAEDLETRIDDRNSQLTDEEQVNRPNPDDENVSNSATNNYTNETVDDYDEIDEEREQHGTDDAYNRTEKTDEYQEDQKTTGDYDYDPADDKKRDGSEGDANKDNMKGDRSEAASGKIRSLYSIVNVDPSSSNIELSSVNKSNIVDVYKQFTDQVQNNRKQYTTQDWEQVDILWQALNERKDQLDEELETRKNLDVAEYKLEYAAYKSVRQPAQEVEEKVDAKTSQH